MRVTTRFANHLARMILGDVRRASYSHALAWPERRLLCATFNQALEDLRTMPPTSLAHLSARKWMSSEARGHPYYFLDACEILGLDSNAVRERMRDERRHARTKGLTTA